MTQGSKLQEVIERNRLRLLISRVPPRTKEAFIQLANEHFCSDYGMTLHFLYQQAMEYQEFKQRLIDLGLLISRLEDLEERVARLEKLLSKEEMKGEEPITLEGKPFRAKLVAGNSGSNKKPNPIRAHEN